MPSRFHPSRGRLTPACPAGAASLPTELRAARRCRAMRQRTALSMPRAAVSMHDVRFSIPGGEQ